MVAFDEFRDILVADSRLDAVMRSEIERHADIASYVFAGSRVGMMRELFASKRRAFYGQAAAIDLGPLDPQAVAAYLEQRFAQGGKRLGDALGPLLDLGEGHPQRTMLLPTASSRRPRVRAGQMPQRSMPRSSGSWSSRAAPSCARYGTALRRPSGEC